MVDLKRRLDEESFEKLRQLVKRKTDIQNIDETNIKVIKEAINLLRIWLEEVYLLDRPFVQEDSGLDIENLFKVKDNN
jgi:rRNA maturation endonuclease Nob1